MFPPGRLRNDLSGNDNWGLMASSSGKYILLKLWSPAKDQNIDIQSIVAHGFAGPRFFPAVQMI